MLIKLKQEFMGSAAGKILDVADADARTLFEKGIGEPAGDEALSPVIAKAMETAMGRIGDSVGLIIDTTLKRFQETQEQARRNSVPAIFGPNGNGDTKHNFGDWLRHAIICCTGKGRSAAEAADHLEKTYGQSQYQQKAALGESSGVTGGYTVPTQFAEQIQQLMAEDTFIRPRAFIQPMTSGVMQIPYLDVTTAPSAAGISAFFGGMQAKWTAEAQSRTEYEPQFKQLELRPWELSAYSVSSNVLLQDSAIGLEKFLYQLFAKVIGWTEEYAFLQGNGVGKPQGMITSNSYIAVTRANPGKLSYADVANCLSRLLPSSLQRAIWVVHPYGLIDLVQLRDAAGRVVWVDAMGGATKGVPGYLFGRPVFVSEKVPTYGTKGDLSLLDPGLYVIGDRMSLEVAASEHVNFLQNQMTWRVVERVDGQPWIEKSITLADASSTVSPFVGVAT
jgi:HK97 family phage major capsid protein